MDNKVFEDTDVVESTTDEKNAETTALASLGDLNMTNVSVDLFGTSNAKKITSLDLEDEENADMLLNATQEPDFKLYEEINKELVVIGCYLIERDVQNVDEKTGEVRNFKEYTTFLFDKDGMSHVSGSNSCYQSFSQIVALKGMPTRERPLTLIPIKTPAKEQGHFYLRLKVKKVK